MRGRVRMVHQLRDFHQLELAIARYVEAYEATHDPELLFRIGEIYERLDRAADAVRYFERYRARPRRSRACNRRQRMRQWCA